MRVNFGFVRTAQTKLLANGTIKIYGGLLDELKQLRPGDVLKLTGKDGREYVVANWGDAVKEEKDGDRDN